MAQKFGTLLRKTRELTGKSMGALARHLGVSVTYISDVERNTRAPLTKEKIDLAAAFLGVDPGILHNAATESRGSVQLDVTGAGRRKMEFGSALARSWGDLNDSEVMALQKTIQDLLAKRTKETGG